MSSRFAVSRETRVQALLSRLIPSVAGVAPEDEVTSREGDARRLKFGAEAAELKQL